MEINALLDQEGGLNKGKNTPKAFLKLFARTLSLESNRNLSILLEAILKTHSRSMLHQVFMPTGLHVLVTMLLKFQSKQLMTAILRKGLRVLQHLVKCGVVEGKRVTHCTRHFCLHKMCKLLYDLTEHGDEQVRMLASNFQILRFEIPRETHFTHVRICEEARKKALRKQAQEEQGLEEGEIPVDEE